MINNYNQLPVGRYLEICDVIRNDALDEVERQAQIIGILAGIPAGDVLNLPLMEYTALAASSRFLEQELPKPIISPSKAVKLGDLVLVPTVDLQKMTAAQYVDFQTMCTGKEEQIVPLLSTLLVPKGCAYCQGYDVADVQKAIADKMPVAHAVALLAFFFKRWSASIASFHTYCDALLKVTKTLQPKKAKKIQAALSARAGAGSIV